MKHNPSTYMYPLTTHRSQSWGTGNNDSAAVNCQKWRMAAFHVNVGVIGASGTVDAKVQESDDGSTNWTDVPGDGPGSLAAITQITATNGEGRIEVVLGERKPYLRLRMAVGTAASQAYSECILIEPIDSGVAKAAATWKKAAFAT